MALAAAARAAQLVRVGSVGVGASLVRSVAASARPSLSQGAVARPFSASVRTERGQLSIVHVSPDRLVVNPKTQLSTVQVQRMSLADINAYFKTIFESYRGATSRTQLEIRSEFHAFMDQLSPAQVIVLRQDASTAHYAGILGVLAQRVDGIVMRSGTDGESVHLDLNAAYGANRAGAGALSREVEDAFAQHGTSLTSNAVQTTGAAAAYVGLRALYADVFGAGVKTKVMIMNTGGEAVSQGLQACQRLVCARDKVDPKEVVFLFDTHSFHGRTGDANPFRVDQLPIGGQPDEHRRIKLDFSDDAALRDRIQKEREGGRRCVLVVEPLKGEGAGEIRSKAFIDMVRGERQKGLVVLADEVQTACAAPQSPSMARAMGLEFDVMTFAKSGGAASSPIPISGVVVRDADALTMFPVGSAGGTYSSPTAGGHLAAGNFFTMYARDEKGLTVMQRNALTGKRLLETIASVKKENPSLDIEGWGAGAMAFLEIKDPVLAQTVHHFLLHFREVAAHAGLWDQFLKEVTAHNITPSFDINKFAGVVQKMTGDAHNVMRLSASIGASEDWRLACFVLQFALEAVANPQQLERIQTSVAKVTKIHADQIAQVETGRGIDMGPLLQSFFARHQ